MKLRNRKILWRLLGFVLGIGFIWHGYTVFKTGVLLNAEIRGNVVIISVEYATPFSIFFVIVGLWILASAVRSIKNDL
jgi:hypothetical protein